MGMILSKQLASLLAFEFTHLHVLKIQSYTETWINFNFAEKYDELHLTILLFTYKMHKTKSHFSFCEAFSNEIVMIVE